MNADSQDFKYKEIIVGSSEPWSVAPQDSVDRTGLFGITLNKLRNPIVTS